MLRRHFLINTPLQRGAAGVEQGLNRFSGFSPPGFRLEIVKTAKAVEIASVCVATPLKRMGVRVID
jgi:hypothetical protein